MAAPATNPTARARVALVGAAGYAGAELALILARHPSADLVGLFGSGRRAEPEPIASVHPRLRGIVDLAIEPASPDRIVSLRPRAVFLATPVEASLELAPPLLDAGLTVIDLSAAFRLKDPAVFERYYRLRHPRPDLCERAVYGLPELFRDRLPGASLVAAPGCYPTSAILPLAPLAAVGAIRAGTRPIVDSVSGVSGAGRGASDRTSFCEVSLSPYGVQTHRHGPEIDAYAGTGVVFTPHLGPFDRGILSTIHADLSAGWTPARVADTLLAAYADETFVRLLPAGSWPSVAGVRGTNFCDLAWAADEAHSHLILFSALDNLVKGAAGQAVQCFNVLVGAAESAGLEGRSA